MAEFTGSLRYDTQGLQPYRNTLPAPLTNAAAANRVSFTAEIVLTLFSDHGYRNVLPDLAASFHRGRGLAPSHRLGGIIRRVTAELAERVLRGAAERVADA